MTTARDFVKYAPSLQKNQHTPEALRELLELATRAEQPNPDDGEPAQIANARAALAKAGRS